MEGFGCAAIARFGQSVVSESLYKTIFTPAPRHSDTPIIPAHTLPLPGSDTDPDPDTDTDS